MKLLQGDCLELLKDIDDNSVDMILCDLPYGQTHNKWDSVIPLDKLWKQYKRVIKENGCVALFGQGMFTADLMYSNKKWWKYNLIWDKVLPAGFLNATNFPGGPGSNYYCIPMSFESYIVFYNKDHVNKYLGGKLPETMDELIDMANKVKADSGGDVAGAVMRGLRTDTNIDTISGLVFNA